MINSKATTARIGSVNAAIPVLLSRGFGATPYWRKNENGSVGNNNNVDETFPKACLSKLASLSTS